MVDRSSDIMMRQESILILPNNTLRLIDLPVVTRIYNALEKKPECTKENEIYKLVCRKEKSLGKIFDIDQSLVDQLTDAEYSLFYKVAPRTNLYKMLEPLFVQSFITKITVAYPDLGYDRNEITSSELEKFNKIFYKNTYDELVKTLSENEWTCLVLDDIDLLDRLTSDERLDFKCKTIFLSKIGYNYYYNNETNMLLVKNLDKIMSRHIKLEIYTFDLFNFTKEDKGD